MSMPTSTQIVRSQLHARRAYGAVAGRFESDDGQRRAGGGDPKKYLSFARAFPTLIHTCGLTQASAFALAKGGHQAAVLDDLAKVLDRASGLALHAESRGEPGAGRPAPTILDYMLLTREALAGASWLKRYAEALLDNADSSAESSQESSAEGSSAGEARA